VITIKLSSSYAQAIAILVMLAELPETESLKSSEISQRMNVSHSYLQKIATKLRHADLVTSLASKQGGYRIKKNLHEITFLDIYEAVEGAQPFLHNVNLEPIHQMFIDPTVVAKKSEIVISIHSAAETAYKEELKTHLLVEILPKDSSGNILQIDWKTIIQN
jgi:Rrf2 family protein